MVITLVAGARPNFMKIAPLIRAVDKARQGGKNIAYRLVHTGQHYDKNMSGDFFQQLGIPAPHANLESGGGTQAEQTASIMVRFEQELVANRPDVVVVVGDVTSTLACTIAAKKLNVDVVHVEAGIRSGDMTMPEEINRIVTDSICDHFFTTSEVANQFLRSSGKSEGQIHFVGNTMIDTLYQNLDRLEKPEIWDKAQLKPHSYLLLTLHRPANVDDPDNLKQLLLEIMEGSGNSAIIFPVHPRTRRVLDGINLPNADRLFLTDPMGYLQFIYLVKQARGIVTDSGGITEEATVLNVPCMILRNSTERPETVTVGTNELVGTQRGKLLPFLDKLLKGNWKKGSIPPLWDGHTSERIIQKLINLYSQS